MSESPEPKRPTVHHIPIKCESPTEKRQITAMHAPVPAPPVDDMKPQNISFIGKCFFPHSPKNISCVISSKNSLRLCFCFHPLFVHSFMCFKGNDDELTQGIRGLNITSGSRTYRIPSPTRPSISRNSFQPHPSLREATPSPSGTPEVTPLDPTDAGEKGFYICFDNDAPKKPKPTLRVKRTSPKKVNM